MVRLLSGHTHQVFTGVTVIVCEPDGEPFSAISAGDGSGQTASRRLHFHVTADTFCDRTDVTVCPISEEAALAYVKTAEPYDKAGGYAIQGFFGRYITRIDGDYNNVKGLPVGRLFREYLADLI